MPTWRWPLTSPLSSSRLANKPARRSYHAGPKQFGRYPLLPSSMAITSYPDPLHVPEHISRPNYVPRNFFSAPIWEHEAVSSSPSASEGDRIKLGTQYEVDIRKAGKMASEVLNEIGKLVLPGVATSDLDRRLHEMIVARGAYPSTLGYSGYPKSCTTSVNNVIAHGIPDDRQLHEEDIINIDITLFLNGYHGDTSRTFVLPGVDRLGRDLVEATREALDLGVRACRPGKRFQDIGAAIHEFAQKHGFSVNTQFTGHGIGRNFHLPPWILHARNNEAGIMQPGDCFTIEPCLVQGGNARGIMWDDGWTMATETGARSAQFEHQVLVTEDGVDILTLSPA